MKRINLLPKLRQRELSQERLFYSISVAVIIAIIILLSGVLVQFMVWTYLDRKVVSINEEIELLKRTANKTENAAVKAQIRTANAQIKDFTTLAEKIPQWSSVMESFMQHIPTGVRISQFDADIKNGEIDISGFSPTRDLVIDLYNNINTDKEHFKSINYPLENVSQPTNVKFYFTFTVADGLLVKGVPTGEPEAAPAAAEGVAE